MGPRIPKSSGRAVLHASAAVLLAAAPAAADPGGDVLPPVNSQSRAIDRANPAIVYVQTVWHAKVWVEAAGERIAVPQEWTSGCTGVIAGSAGYVITAGHCVDPGSEGAQATARERTVDWMVSEDIITADLRPALLESVQSGEIRWQVTGAAAGSEPDRSVRVQLGGTPVAGGEPADGSATARVLEVVPHSGGDVALLKIPNAGLPVVQLAEEASVQVGDDVLAIGYPLDHPAAEIALTTRNGRVNALQAVRQGSGSAFYEVSAPLSHGMSGGPSVGADGRLIGIASFTLREGEGNFVVPSEVVAQVLKRNGVDTAPGEIDQFYQAGLENYYHGYYTDAIDDFNRVLGLMPQHATAAAKKLSASDLRTRNGRDVPRPEPAVERDQSWDPLGVGVPVVAGAAVLAVVALLCLVLLRRRRRAARRRAAAGVAPNGTADVGSGPESGAGTDAGSGSDAGSFTESGSAAESDWDSGTGSDDPLSAVPVFRGRVSPVSAVPGFGGTDPRFDGLTGAGRPVRAVPDESPTAPIPAARDCGGCGAPGAPGMRFCGHCGRETASEVPVIPAQPGSRTSYEVP